jgi:luciferase family oxidoreductase group 1
MAVHDGGGLEIYERAHRSILSPRQGTPLNLPLSVLDLCPLPDGSTPAQAVANTLDLARQTEKLGYRRYWLAEHHNTGMLACSAPEVLIAAVAGTTRTIRVGSGGIMLPNHTPLKVAETFRVLEALSPGRIDLGLGRAPGTDALTAMALRRSHDPAADDFPGELAELVGYLTDDHNRGGRFARIVASPVGTGCPQLWILGSSLFGAQMAAVHGFGFAFAHHINPSMAEEAMTVYRRYFRPSRFCSEARAILGVSAICADTDEEAERLALSARLVTLRIGQGRVSQPVPNVEEAAAYPYTDEERMKIDANRPRLQTGSPSTLRKRFDELVSLTQADEIMVNTIVHGHAERLRSYDLLTRMAVS